MDLRCFVRIPEKWKARATTWARLDYDCRLPLVLVDQQGADWHSDIYDLIRHTRDGEGRQAAAGRGGPPPPHVAAFLSVRPSVYPGLSRACLYSRLWLPMAAYGRRDKGGAGGAGWKGDERNLLAVSPRLCFLSRAGWG